MNTPDDAREAQAREIAQLNAEIDRLSEAERQRTAELAILNSVGEAMVKTLDVQTVTRIVGDKLREIFDTDVISIALLDTDSRMIQPMYEFDKGEGGYVDYLEPYPLGRGLTSKVISSRQPMLLGNLEEQVANGAYISPEMQAQSSGVMAESWLAVPIIANDRVLGTVGLGDYRQNAFNQNHVNLLQTLSANMGVAIENARLFAESERLFKAEQQRVAELAIINSVQAALAAELNIQGIYDAVGDKIREIFHQADVAIRIYDPRINLLHYPYVYDEGKRIQIDSHELSEEGIAAHVLRTRATLVINENMASVAERYGSRPLPGTRIEKSSLFVPMVTGDLARGMIDISDYEHEHAFSESDVRLLETLANSMSVALENARLFDETQRLLKETEAHAAELAVINSVQEGLASKLEFQGIIDLVGDKITEIFASDATSISLYDRGENRVRVAYLWEDGTRLPPASMTLGEGLTWRVISTKKPLLLHTSAEANEQGAVWMGLHAGEPEEKGTESSLLVPMITGDEVTGVVSVQSYRTDAYGESHLRLLSTLAASMSVALHNARLFDETQRLLKETEDRNAELAVINSVQEGLASKLEFQSIIDLIGDKVTEIFNAQATLISLYNPGPREIDHRYLMERGQRLRLERPVPIDKFRQRVVETRKPWMINQNYPQLVRELGEEPILEGEEPRSLIFVPMIVGEEVTGIISLQNLDTENAFSESDLRLLSTIAASMSVALENARLFKAEQQRAAELAIINSVQAGLASRLDMQAIYDLVGNKISEVFRQQTCFIMIYDRQAELENYPFIVEDGIRQHLDPLPHSEEGFGPLAMRTRQPVMINENLEARAAEIGSYALGGSVMTKSAMYVPLLIGNDARGVISVQNTQQENAYTEADLRLLTTLTSSVSVALENARLFDETQRLLKETEERNAELGIINGVQAALAHELSVQGIYDAVGDKIREIFNKADVGIRIYDPKSNLVHYPYVYESGVRISIEATRLRETGFNAHVLRTRQPLMINENMAQEMEKYGSRVLPGTHFGKSMIMVPMIAGDQARGVVDISDFERDHAFSESDVRLLQTLANSMSVALENARLFDETQRLLGETEQRAAELAIVNSIQVALASKLDIQAIYDLVSENIREVFHVRVFDIVTYDLEKNLISMPYSYEDGDRSVMDPREPFGFRLHVIKTGAPLLVNRDAEQIMAQFDNPVITGAAPKSLLFVPLLVGDQVRGVLSIQDLDREDAFHQSDVRLMQTLANAMSVALENARLFNAEQQRAAELAIINSVSRAMSSRLDADAIIKTVGDQVRETFRVEVANIYLYEPSTNMIHLPYSYDRKYVDTPPFEFGEGLTSKVIRTREPLILGSFEEIFGDGAILSPNAPDDDLMPQSYLGVPILLGDRVLGVVDVQSYKGISFDEGDARLLSTLASSMGVALENARLFGETQRLLEETRHRASELGVINNIQEGLASRLDAQAIIDLVGDKVTEIFASDATMICLSDRENRLLHFPYMIESGVRLEEEAVPLGEGFNSRVISTREPLLFNTWAEAVAGGTISASAHIEEAEQKQVESILAVPMIMGEEATGAVSVQSYTPNAYDETHIRLLSTLTASMGVALQNARLFAETERLLEESRQRAAELAIINSVSEAMSSQLDVDAIIRTVGDQVRDSFRAETATVQLYDAATNMISFPYMYDRGYVSYPSIPYGKGLTSTVIRSRRPLLLNTHEEMRQHGSITLPNAVDEEVTESYLGVPIIVGDQVMGVLDVQSYRPNAFDAGHARLLSTLASSMGVALENARLYVDAGRRAGQMATLAEAGQEISASHDLPAIMENIARRAHEVCRARTTVLRLANPDGKSFRAVAALGMYAEQFKAEVIDAGQGVTGAIILSGQPEIIPDLGEDPRTVHVQGTPEQEEQPETMMVAPLVVRGQTLGVLTLYRWKAAGQFTPVDLDFLSGLARQAAISIENVGLLEAAQESRRRLADIIDFLPDATLVIDREGRVIAWNHAIEEMTGMQATDVVGKADYEYAVPFYGERRPILIDLVLREDEELEHQYEQVRRHGSILVGEAFVPNLRGKPAYLYATASALRDAKGETVGAIETIRDISDRRRAEQELRQAKAEAEAATQAKSAFLATMSHEIRTPMNAIIGMSGLLLNTGLEPQQQEFAEIIRSSGDALLGIINDILDFSKIEAGRLELEYTTFDLRECLESALDLMGAKTAEKGLDLAIEVAPGVPAAIVGDVTRLRQVAINLLNNAVKFTQQGEVVLSVSNGADHGQPGPIELHFSVRDTGIGIPADRLDRLFQSFSQVDTSTSRKYGGTGLGLAISKRLVEMMGGKIWVESEVGAGSTFHFTIRAEPVALDVRTRFKGEQPRLAGRRLLVVDDNPTNRRILRLQTHDWGMITVETGSPAEALAWVQRGDPFDLAILDLHMPEMDGTSLAREIRKLRDERKLPLVMLSSMGARDAAGDQVEWAAFLTKPIKQSQLFNALAGIFGRVQEEPAAQPVTQPVKPDPGMASRWPLKILLAEDNAYNQKLASLLLGQMGYRADVASNGLEAIQALERQSYDVILMDVQMPEMDGLEASRQICARWPDQRPHIIAMTANAMQGDREMCLAAGMDDYLSKPIRVHELANALQQAGSKIGRKDAT